MHEAYPAAMLLFVPRRLKETLYTLAYMDFESPEELYQRLRRGDRPVVFLVGSALTMSTAGRPGVCDVDAMIRLIKERVASPRDASFAARAEARRASEVLEEALVRAGDGGGRYQVAFQKLKSMVGGAAAANTVIREAVLKARTVSTAVDLDDLRALAELEGSGVGWHLGPAVKALGQLVARDPMRFGRAVLTTNFDPLIEVAIRAAGGRAQAVALVGDDTLPAVDPIVTSVVHLHGLWRGDTLHTTGALIVDRATLRRSFARLLDEVTLVALAYGGWDDVLTTTLAELTKDTGSQLDLLWCFFQREQAEIERRYPKLLEVFRKLGERVVCYAGVDCNAVLPRLRAAVDGEGELIGRDASCEGLFAAIDGEHAVEILGEPHMKRSALLTWAKKMAPRDAQVGLISARELARATPEMLVRKVAEAVGRLGPVEVEIHSKRAVPTDEDAIRALRLLHGVWMLIDDADALARPGHGFTEGFFAALRSRVQAREIRWISVSRKPLGPLFQQVGLSSQFLNDSMRVHAGGLDPEVVERALAARLGEHGRAAMALTGTLPRLVYRMFEAEYGDVEAAMRELGEWADGMCVLWWEREGDEQALLKKAVGGVALATLSSYERGEAAELCKRGLLVETAGGYALNGEIWERYVRARE